MRSNFLNFVFLISFIMFYADAAQSTGFGRFEGVIDITKKGVKNCPKSDYGSEDANFIVKSEIRYFAPDGSKWIVPIGACVNGASIPRALWTIAGAPWTGKYVKSAMIHDYQCTVRKFSSNEVHRAFYYAMRAEGVERSKAVAMYYAVVAFGPRWRTVNGVKAFRKCEGGVCTKVLKPVRQTILVRIKTPEIDFKKLEKDPELQNLSLSEVEKLAHQAFAEAYKEQR